MTTPEQEPLWECPDCGFTFHAQHHDDGKPGEYSCPLCAELELEAKLREVEAERDRLQHDKDMVALSYSNRLRRSELDYESTIAAMKTALEKKLDSMEAEIDGDKPRDFDRGWQSAIDSIRAALGREG